MSGNSPQNFTFVFEQTQWDFLFNHLFFFTRPLITQQRRYFHRIAPRNLIITLMHCLPVSRFARGLSKLRSHIDLPSALVLQSVNCIVFTFLTENSSAAKNGFHMQWGKQYFVLSCPDTGNVISLCKTDNGNERWFYYVI